MTPPARRRCRRCGHELHRIVPTGPWLDDGPDPAGCEAWNPAVGFHRAEHVPT